MAGELWTMRLIAQAQRRVNPKNVERVVKQERARKRKRAKRKTTKAR